MATQEDITNKRETITEMRQEIAEIRNNMAVEAVEEGYDIQLDRLSREEDALAAELEALRSGDASAQPVVPETLPAGAVPPPPPANATKDELYQLAQDADLPGRSDMTKDELAAALANPNMNKGVN